MPDEVISNTAAISTASTAKGNENQNNAYAPLHKNSGMEVNGKGFGAVVANEDPPLLLLLLLVLVPPNCANAASGVAEKPISRGRRVLRIHL